MKRERFLNQMRLDRYAKGGYTPGAPLWKCMLWYYCGTPIVSSRFLPCSAIKRALLRLFGARIGTNVRIKPGVRIKFPWRLSVGDYSWIGEDVWIDNLAAVSIGAHCCISQAAYLCTGSHDWSKEGFDLITRPITIGDRAWVAARASVAPGITLGTGAVVVMGSTVMDNVEDWAIYRGNPAVQIGVRRARTSGGE